MVPELPADALLFIPHRPPLCLINRLLVCDDDHAEADAFFEEGHFLADENGEVAGEVCFELVAQAFAAAKGYTFMREGGDTGEGFLVGLRDFDISGVIQTGETLHIVITKAGSFDEFHDINGEVAVNGEVIARCMIRAWLNKVGRA